MLRSLAQRYRGCYISRDPCPDNASIALSLRPNHDLMASLYHSIIVSSLKSCRFLRRHARRSAPHVHAWAVGAPAARTVGWAVCAACRPVGRGRWRAASLCRAPHRSDPRRTQRCMRLWRRRRHRTAARRRSREMRGRSPMPNYAWDAAVKAYDPQTLYSSGAHMGSRK